FLLKRGEEPSRMVDGLQASDVERQESLRQGEALDPRNYSLPIFSSARSNSSRSHAGRQNITRLTPRSSKRRTESRSGVPLVEISTSPGLRPALPHSKAHFFDRHGCMLSWPGLVAQSSPETASRHAEGVGFDGDAQRQAIISSPVRKSNNNPK